MTQGETDVTLKLRLAVFYIGILNLAPVSVFMQSRSQDGEAAAGCAACGAGVGVMILIPIVMIALSFALLIWVARDAKARGLDNAILWMALVFFTSIIGLIIYIFARPQGDLMQCRHCGNKRLKTSAKCPTCGNA
jgi:hypothetical protein